MDCILHNTSIKESDSHHTPDERLLKSHGCSIVQGLLFNVRNGYHYFRASTTRPSNGRFQPPTRARRQKTLLNRVYKSHYYLYGLLLYRRPSIEFTNPISAYEMNIHTLFLTSVLALIVVANPFDEAKRQSGCCGAINGTSYPNTTRIPLC
jgi:hypothetical protein